MRLAAAAAVTTLAACGAVLEPPAEPAGASAPVLVRVATWNVHDLFDAEDRMVPPGDQDRVLTPEEAALKRARVAAVLARLDADLVFLQEVETSATLAALGAEAGYRSAALVEGNDPRGLDVAVLARLPRLEVRSHAEELGPDGRRLWPRDCVEVLAAPSGRPLVLVGSHLSSALSDDGTRRRWQAARLREIADGAREGDPEALVLAGGDLNDEPASVALEPLLADGVWSDPVPDGTATWAGGSSAARLDYLLLPADRRGAVLAVTVDRGADVAAASDHRPVILDLRLD